MRGSCSRPGSTSRKRSSAVQDLHDLIGNDPELRLLARRLLHQRGRGRRKGERRPGDLTNDQRRAREAALKDAERIREVWQRKFGRTNRKESPTALDIAARRRAIATARSRPTSLRPGSANTAELSFSADSMSLVLVAMKTRA
jgi:hypothetical protein